MLNKEEIKHLLEKQRDFYSSGATREILFRIKQMQKLAQAIEYREEEILRALKLDLGKSPVEAYLSELGMVKAELSYIIKNLRQWAKPERVRTPMLFFGGKSQIYPEPLGQVLIISPWNYPFYLGMAPLVGAMAAGNCVVLKPSELAPHTSALLCKLSSEIFAEEYIAVLEGGAESSQALLEQCFDHIFFTGGPMIGKIVMQAAAQNLTPVTLELGGKSPCIVEKDIQIEYAARRIVWGKFLNAGQTCVAPDYLLVNRQIKEALLAQLQQVISEFYGPDPRDCSDYARIINEPHFRRLEALLSDGLIICGGELDRSEKYIAPTIIDGISAASPIMQEEIFGPLLPVLDYESLDEAINFVNSRPKPLALYFFSRDKSQQDQILRQTTSGGVCINDTLSHISSPELPFGGVGASGMGSYHGRASFEVFSHRKSVLKQTFLFDFPVKYPPYKISLQQIRRLLKLL